MEAIYAGIVLTGPTQSEHSGPIALPWDRAVQVAPLFRSERKFIAARGNKSSDVTFACLRRYLNLIDAMDARASFIDSLPGDGQLELVQFSGGRTLTIVATAALSSTPTPVLFGRAVHFQFAFTIASLNTAIVDGTGNYLRNENGSIIRNEDGEPLLAD